MQRDHGVDLRTGVTVTSLEGDATGHVRSATTLRRHHARRRRGRGRRSARSATSSGWRAPGWRPAPWGVACDAGCRAFDINGVVTDNIFVAGDVARAPHVLYDYQFLALEHWDNAVARAEVAAHNMVSLEPDRRPHLLLPAFWSGQFGVNIKSVGVPPFGDEVVITQGSVEERRFVAVYGRRGRIVAAVTFNQGKWLEYYEAPDRAVGSVPAPAAGLRPAGRHAAGAGRVPGPGAPHGVPEVVLTGHDPTERGPSSSRDAADAPLAMTRATGQPNRRGEPRTMRAVAPAPSTRRPPRPNPPSTRRRLPCHIEQPPRRLATQRRGS